MKITNLDTKETKTTTKKIDYQHLEAISHCTGSEEKKYDLLVAFGRCLSKNDIKKALEAGELKLYGGKAEFLLNKMEAAGWFAEVEQKQATRWQDEPATAKQYSYIHSLGYSLGEKTITKGQASHIIDMIKSGDAGSLGMAHNDGSY